LRKASLKASLKASKFLYGMPKLKHKKRDASRSKFRDWMRGALEQRIKGNLKAWMKALRGQSLIHHVVLGVVLEVVDQDEIAIDPRMLR
jgi:hypothetical protein